MSLDFCDTKCLLCENLQCYKINFSFYHGICKLHKAVSDPFLICKYCTSRVLLAEFVEIQPCEQCTSLGKIYPTDCQHKLCRNCSAKCNLCETSTVKLSESVKKTKAQYKAGSMSTVKGESLTMIKQGETADKRKEESKDLNGSSSISLQRRTGANDRKHEESLSKSQKSRQEVLSAKIIPNRTQTRPTNDSKVLRVSHKVLPDTRSIVACECCRNAYAYYEYQCNHCICKSCSKEKCPVCIPDLQSSNISDRTLDSENKVVEQKKILGQDCQHRPDFTCPSCKSLTCLICCKGTCSACSSRIPKKIDCCDYCNEILEVIIRDCKHKICIKCFTKECPLCSLVSRPSIISVSGEEIIKENASKLLPQGDMPCNFTDLSLSNKKNQGGLYSAERKRFDCPRTKSFNEGDEASVGKYESIKIRNDEEEKEIYGKTTKDSQLNRRNTTSPLPSKEEYERRKSHYEVNSLSNSIDWASKGKRNKPRKNSKDRNSNVGCTKCDMF